MTRRAAVENSRLVGAVRASSDAVERTVRASRLGRWLTREPEPDVVVIDLRETYTVGPVLAVLDRAEAAIAGRWCDSRIRRSLAALRTALVDEAVRVLGVLLTALSVALVMSGSSAPGLVVALAGLLALFAGGSWADVRNSVAGRFVLTLFTPPSQPERR